MAKAPNFKGVEIELAGTKYILPPLPIKAFSKGDATTKIQRIQADFKKMQGDDFAISSESINDLVSLVTMALQRNYPGIPEDDVENGCEDIMTLFGLFQFLISQSNEMQNRIAEAQKNALREFVENHQK